MNDPIEQYRRLLESAPEGIGGIVEILLGQMSPESAEYLRLSAIPHQFDVAILQIIKPNLDSVTASNLCKEFETFSFITLNDGAFLFHEEVRRYLFQWWLECNQQSEFRDTNRRLANYFENQEQQGSGEARSSARLQRIFHLVGADQADGFDAFERLCRKERYQYHLHTCETVINSIREYYSVLNQDRKHLLDYHEAKLWIDLRRYEKAERRLKDLLTTNCLEPPLHARILYRLGTIKLQRRAWADTIEMFQQGLEYVNAHPETGDQKIKIFQGLATALRKTGKLEEAEEMLNAAISLAETSNDRSALAVNYNSLGNLHRKLRQLRRATEAFHKSLEYLSEGKEIFRPAQVYNNIGLLYADHSEWDAALENLEKSVEISRKAGYTKGQAEALGNLTRIYLNLGQYDKAIQSAEKATSLFLSLRDWSNAGMTVKNLARYYRRAGKFPEARAQFERAAGFFQQAGARDQVTATNSEIERLEGRQGLPRYVLATLVVLACVLLFVLFVGIFSP